MVEQYIQAHSQCNPDCRSAKAAFRESAKTTSCFLNTTGPVQNVNAGCLLTRGHDDPLQRRDGAVDRQGLTRELPPPPGSVAGSWIAGAKLRPLRLDLLLHDPEAARVLPRLLFRPVLEVGDPPGWRLVGARAEVFAVAVLEEHLPVSRVFLDERLRLAGLPERIRETFGGTAYLSQTENGSRYFRRYVSGAIRWTGERALGRNRCANSLRQSFATRIIAKTMSLGAFLRTLKISLASMTFASSSTAMCR